MSSGDDATAHAASKRVIAKRTRDFSYVPYLVKWGWQGRNSGCTGHARYADVIFFTATRETPRESGGCKRSWYTRWLNLAWLFPWANTRKVQYYVTRMYRCEKSTYLTRYAIRCLSVSSDARISFDDLRKVRFRVTRYIHRRSRIPDSLDSCNWFC